MIREGHIYQKNKNLAMETHTENVNGDEIKIGALLN